MADDLDDLLRAAMKTLDAEVPSGYFEALPNQTLARLEGSMQHGTSGTTDREQSTQAPPVRDEDSGLHDIRSLAQSTKQRISSKRITTSPPESEDDILASSSAGWKAVALPQPAKMVSLPEIDELPSKADLKAAAKAAKAAKAVKAEGSVVEKPAAAPVAAVEAAPARSAFSLPSQQKKSKAPLFAVVGVGLAAAAGVVVFMQTQKGDKAPAAAVGTSTATAPVAQKAEPAPAPAVAAQPTATPIETGSAAEPAAADKGEAAAAVTAPPVDTTPPKDDTKNVVTKGAGKKSKVEKTAPKKEETKAPVEKTQKTQKSSDLGPAETKKNADGSEPDFNDLLKEAGVDQNKHEAKPKLEKKMLSADDFKQGMSAVAAKAQGCYKGTQGMASVKLTIAPSGKVSKVTVGGAFAGKPEADCVAGAVKGASFPPWDGGPQSFNYTYLLSE